jgi:quercetin dioxygenase-like cupin family protein
MQIVRHENSPSAAPAEDSFTGDVHIAGYFQRAAPSKLSGAFVTFGPGSRTPWKLNRFGQTLFVTSGLGWGQLEGEEVFEIRAGDLIWCPPGQRHWEGATPNTSLTYVAMHEGTVEFVQRVTDAEYLKGTAIASLGN